MENHRSKLPWLVLLCVGLTLAGYFAGRLSGRGEVTVLAGANGYQTAASFDTAERFLALLDEESKSASIPPADAASEEEPGLSAEDADGTIKEDPPEGSTPVDETEKDPPTIGPGESSPSSGAPQDGEVPNKELIDVNRATVEELTALPGIGEVIAGRIVEYREKNGPFCSKEELTAVKGIGEKTFEKIRDLIVIS